MTHVLENTQLTDTAGSPTRLGTLWLEQPTVLLFVRHFGCLFCREQLAEAERHAEQLSQLGAKLVVIGNGSVEEARSFVDELGTEAQVLTDPARESYCAIGMQRSVVSSVNPRTVAHAFRAWRKGHRQRAVAGDPFQQGGVVVIAPDGDEVFRFVSAHAGEHPDFELVLQALSELEPTHHRAA
jgi:peroxiredoxin